MSIEQSKISKIFFSLSPVEKRLLKLWISSLEAKICLLQSNKKITCGTVPMSPGVYGHFFLMAMPGKRGTAFVRETAARKKEGEQSDALKNGEKRAFLKKNALFFLQTPKNDDQNSTFSYNESGECGKRGVLDGLLRHAEWVCGA
jgi:hypothetical protein